MTQLIENKPPRRALIATLLHFDDPIRVVVLSDQREPKDLSCDFASSAIRESCVTTSVNSHTRLPGARSKPAFLIDRGYRLEIDLTLAASTQVRFLIVAESRFRDLRFAPNFLRIPSHFGRSTHRHQHAAGGKRDGEADREDVYRDADERELERERARPDGRERNDNVVHEKIYGDAVQHAAWDGVLDEQRHEAARHDVNGCGAVRDYEVAEESESRGGESAVAGALAEDAAGDSLQQRNRLQPEGTVYDKRGDDVEDAAEQPGPENRSQRVAVSGSRRCGVHVPSEERRAFCSDAGWRALVSYAICYEAYKEQETADPSSVRRGGLRRDDRRARLDAAVHGFTR